MELESHVYSDYVSFGMSEQTRATKLEIGHLLKEDAHGLQFRINVKLFCLWLHK